MKIAVIGAGAIGALVAGYLKLKNEDVALIGHGDAVGAIKSSGLEISGTRGYFKVNVDAAEKLSFPPRLVILATKTQDVENALRENSSFLKDVTVLTAQNGVAADDIAARYIPKENIVSSIVMFGSTSLEPGKVVHNFEGKFIIGKVFGKNDAKVRDVENILGQAFTVVTTPDLLGMKYLKVFVNASNCIPALLGQSMQEAFSDVNISAISIGIWKEGMEIIKKSGIHLVSLPDFPLERLEKLAAMPTAAAAGIFSGIMNNLSKEPLYGSILQSIKRGKPSEIDYINGTFVNLAEKNNLGAALNKKLVEMVHEVERNNKFFTKEELLRHTKGLYN